MLRGDVVVTKVMDRARSALNQAVRSRVGGDDFEKLHERIWHGDGDRWFTRTDPIWRVHDDTSMFIGGIRALLLQSLHPVAMQAVADHSDYRGDPWGRLQRTSQFLAFTTMGTVPDAEQMIAKVKHVHRFVTGTTPSGDPYDARDPHLLMWIHACEVESFLAAYQAYGAHSLTDAEADTYVAQTAVVAEKLGVIDAPRSTAELERVLAGYRTELVRTPAAAEAADLLLDHPPLPAAARPAYAMLTAGAVALLPPWARGRLRLPYRPLSRGLLARPLADLAMRTLRWAFAVDPVTRAGS